jgi:hypothetical protein
MQCGLFQLPRPGQRLINRKMFGFLSLGRRPFDPNVRGLTFVRYTNYHQVTFRHKNQSLESREYGRRDPSCWPRAIVYAQKLPLTLPTSGGRSVGIVRWRIWTTEFIWFCWLQLLIPRSVRWGFSEFVDVTVVCTLKNARRQRDATECVHAPFSAYNQKAIITIG